MVNSATIATHHIALSAYGLQGQCGETKSGQLTCYKSGQFYLLPTGINCIYDYLLIGKVFLLLTLSSRPREPPPQPLTEPYVKLSLHTALHVPRKIPGLHKPLVPPIAG